MTTAAVSAIEAQPGYSYKISGDRYAEVSFDKAALRQAGILQPIIKNGCVVMLVTAPYGEKGVVGVPLKSLVTPLKFNSSQRSPWRAWARHHYVSMKELTAVAVAAGFRVHPAAHYARIAMDDVTACALFRNGAVGYHAKPQKPLADWPAVPPRRDDPYMRWVISLPAVKSLGVEKWFEFVADFKADLVGLAAGIADRRAKQEKEWL